MRKLFVSFMILALLLGAVAAPALAEERIYVTRQWCDCEPGSADTWDGTADTSWYDSGESTFVLTTAEQMAGLSKLSADGVTFEGKTIELGACIDLGGTCFQPIKLFKGTFDGKLHTIKNLYITMETVNANNYVGLFREVADGTVKNLTMDGAQLVPHWEHQYQYMSEMGIVAAMSTGNSTFETITILNSSAETYNNTVAAVVAEVYGKGIFKDVCVDDTNNIGSYWGSYDTPVGGIVAYAGSGATVQFEDCISSPTLNVYNDACSNYQYYLYRRSGMLVGVDRGASSITAGNTKVGFGEWNQYTYCEFKALGRGSYAAPDEWKFTRTDDKDRCYEGHPHESFESCTVLLPFENLIGYERGIAGKLEYPGVSVVDTPYHVVRKVPATGDGAQLMLWSAMLVAGVVVLTASKRKAFNR